MANASDKQSDGTLLTPQQQEEYASEFARPLHKRVPDVAPRMPAATAAGTVEDSDEDPLTKSSLFMPEGSSQSSVSHHAVVRDAVRQSAALTIPFLVMNTLAAVVTCYGLLEDNAAVVIGAMLIAMLLGPISGIALALIDGESELLWKSLITMIGGALAVLVVSFIVGLIHRNIPITHEILARTMPNLLDLMIALAAGAAGAYSTVSPRLGVGLVGVVIATALVPPLSTCGICLARHETALAWGSFLLFFTSLVAIQFSSSVVMWLSGFHAVTGSGLNARERRRRLFAGNFISLAVLVLLVFVMATNFLESLAEHVFENATRKHLADKLSAFPGVHLADVRFKQHKDAEDVVAVVRSPYSFTPARVQILESGVPTLNGKPTRLEIMSVIVKETTRDGYLSSLDHAEPDDTTDTKIFGH